MIVMVSNQTGIEVGILAMRYPGKVGHMFSPGGERGPWRELPHALDNDAWPAKKNKRPRNVERHLPTYPTRRSPSSGAGSTAQISLFGDPPDDD